MLVEAKGICKSYSAGGSQLSVLNGVSLELAEGETLALTGESGSGKSTLLHLLAALDTPDEGTIILDGTRLIGLDDVRQAEIRRQKIGLVFQQFNLIPALDVAANIAFQAKLAGRHDAAWQKELVDRLDLTELLSRYPEQLSGGQQQRVAIGRALAVRPRVLMVDEPTGNLDEASADAVMRLLLDLVSETNAGLLMVTHSTLLAGRLSRCQHLSGGRLT